MQTVLMAAQPEWGHLNPLLAIAERMAAAGLQPVFVHFGPPGIQEGIESRGFASERLPAPLSARGLAVVPWLSGAVETATVIELFTAQPLAYARRILGVLDRLRPAAVVADFSMVGAHLAAEAAGLPWLSLYHAGLNYPGPGVPTFASGNAIGESLGWRSLFLALVGRVLGRRLRQRLRHARKRLGLPPGPGDPMFWSSPWATLISSAAEAEAPRDPLPPQTFFVGPCFGRSAAQAEFSWDALAVGKSRVYVSLGTVFNRRPALFRPILEALRGGHYQVIVSAGAAYASLAPLAHADLLIYPRVPQRELLDHVDLVIHHGGNNTVNETLAAGLPMLVIPIGGEQSDNASRVVYLGAGLRARAGRGYEIRAKVELLLGDPAYRQRAARVSAILARSDGAGAVVRFLERILTTRMPIERPRGYPLTVTLDTPMPWEFVAGAWSPPGGRESSSSVQPPG